MNIRNVVNTVVGFFRPRVQKPVQKPVVVRGFRPLRQAKVVRPTVKRASWPNWAEPLVVMPARPRLASTARMARKARKRLLAAKRAERWADVPWATTDSVRKLIARVSILTRRMQLKDPADPDMPPCN